MASIKRLKPGMVVWEVGHSRRLGNTTLQYKPLFQVEIIEVNKETGVVKAKWNRNSAKEYGERDFKRWRTKEPAPKKQVWGTDSY